MTGCIHSKRFEFGEPFRSFDLKIDNRAIYQRKLFPSTINFDSSFAVDRQIINWML
jgi:hypothetical protein